MDGYENEPSAEKALFSLLDQAPFKSVHISAGAKAEQGFSIAKKARVRYPNMLVFFRKLPNDFQHLHYPDVNKLYESLSPWSDGGNLILPLENEPGVGDLQQQNAWYAPAIERFGKAGIRVTAPAMQTHNRFPSSMLLDTWIALDKYNGFIDLHYYADPGDDTYSFPIDHIHKTIAAYCKPKGIATRFIISELGYLYKLGAYAGYHGGQGGGMDGGTYAKLLIAEARANPDVLYHIFGMGNQAPWGECNIDGDEDVIKPIVAYNKEKPDMPTTPDIPAPTEGGVKATLTKIPQEFINVRHQPNGNDVGDLLVGDVVTYYPDAKQGEWVYQTPLTPVQRPTGRQNAAAGWASEQGGKVTFEKVVDPPPVEPEPEPEPQTITLTIDQYNVLVASLSIAQRVLADIAPMPAPAPIPVPSLPFDAIDVSQAQGVIDWQAVAQSGVRAAYIRATQGTSQIDTKFVENAQNAAAAGIAIGFYHPLIASQSGAAQAAHFLNQIKPYPWQLPPAIDVELDNDQTPTRIADELYAMATAVEAAIGQRPVLYSSWGFWNGKVGTQHDSYFAECPLWVANYTTAPAPMIPRCWSSYWLWQYTSSGSVAGIGGRVDLNRRSKETVLVAA